MVQGGVRCGGRVGEERVDDDSIILQPPAVSGQQQINNAKFIIIR